MNRMKRYIAAIALLLIYIAAWPQGPKCNFNPKKFESELKQYIVDKVPLTPQESAKFLPLYEEMRAKQRYWFQRDKQNSKVNPSDRKACERAVRQHDEIELQLKKIQQTYHNKFLKILPANKVYLIIKAENDFHRKKFRRAVKSNRR